MSQKIFLCIIGVLIVLFTGCGRQQGQMSYIGAESAKKTALKAALLTEKEISFINADLDTLRMDWIIIGFVLRRLDRVTSMMLMPLLA